MIICWKLCCLACNHEEEEKKNGDWFDQKNFMMTDDFLGVFEHRYFDYKELDREQIIHRGKQNMQKHRGLINSTLKYLDILNKC